DVLARRGVQVDAAALSAADARAKRRLDLGDTIQATSDLQRGWLYFNLVLTEAGVQLNAATEAALAELHDYHSTHNLWEYVPEDVRPALDRFTRVGLRLVVVSNSNGTLRAMFDRLRLTPYFHTIIDSLEEGIEKPDPRLFAIALARSGASPESTAHVGDLYHVDVIGARAAGLQAVLLDAAGFYGGGVCGGTRPA